VSIRPGPSAGLPSDDGAGPRHRTGPRTARRLLVGASLLCGLIASALAQLSVGIAMPGVSIGIDLPVYPQLVRVPGYPVYYAPQMASNYFFHDGVYWVYQGDNWYASSWYNGPWVSVQPAYVPHYVLRVPVRYYRQPPSYFRGWRADAAPRWGDHWGRDWEARNAGWNQWDRNTTPRPAPLPTYQRQYSGQRYPGTYEQYTIRTQNYRYQPREEVTRQHYQQYVQPRANPQDRYRQNGPDGQGRGRDDRDHSRGQSRDDNRGQGRDDKRDHDDNRGKRKD
jgi:hypothetical protein